MSGRLVVINYNSCKCAQDAHNILGQSVTAIMHWQRQVTILLLSVNPSYSINEILTDDREFSVACELCKYYTLNGFFS